MRLLVFSLGLALVGACGANDGVCKVDGDCPSDAVCARNSECLPPGEVRVVRVTWTVNGMPASDTTCSSFPDLYLYFGGTQTNDTFGYSPVPCNAGLFTVDKMPRRFVSVEIGADGRFSDAKSFDAQGNAAFNLMP